MNRIIYFTVMVFLCACSLSAQTRNSLSMSISSDSVCVGDYTELDISISGIKSDEFRALGFDIFVNGHTIKNKLIGLEYAFGNTVHVGNTLHVIVPIYLYNDGFYVFGQNGKYELGISYEGNPVSINVNVGPVPEKERAAYELYGKIAESKLSLYFLDEEYMPKAYAAAQKMVDDFPISRYSKIPILYWTARTREKFLSIVSKRLKLVIGDKVNMAEFRAEVKKLLEKNISLLETLKDDSSELVKERAILEIASNAIFSRSELESDEIYRKHTDSIELLKGIRDDSKIKSNRKIAKELLEVLEELSSKTE